MNASGQVTGYASTADGNTHAFLWDGTRMQDLGTFGGSYSSGEAINAAGQVTGLADTADGSHHAFFWDGTRMHDLGTVQGHRHSSGVAINDSGQVIGNAFNTRDGAYEYVRAALWDGTTLHDLDPLIDPADPLQPFVFLAWGVDINDRGQVLANGFRNGEEHAYVVSPVPPPASTPPPAPTPPTVEPSGGGGGAFDVIAALALLCLGLAGLGLSRRRKAH